LKLSDFKTYDIRHFTPAEVIAVSKGLETVDVDLIWRLDRLRRQLRVPVILTELNKLKHAKNSYHYRNPCRAADYKTKAPRCKVMQAAVDVKLPGFGVYKWGYHSDSRMKSAFWKYNNHGYVPLI